MNRVIGVPNIKKHHNGQSMVEFIIVTPILIMLIFGALQFAFIYHAKTTLNYAAFQAARDGAVSNGRISTMENAFVRSMAPIYTHNNTPADLIAATTQLQTDVDSNFVNIQVLNPTPEAFGDTDFGVVIDNERQIPNDNLMFRPNGTGPTSQVTIQDANLLKIRVSYCYPMYVPYIDRLLALLLTLPVAACDGCTGAFSTANTFEWGCLNSDRFPIHATATVRMQSPAMWTAMSGGTYNGPASATAPCPWCGRNNTGGSPAPQTSPLATPADGGFTLSIDE
jgi:Flp pilus assembly protein TadG